MLCVTPVAAPVLMQHSLKGYSKDQNKKKRPLKRDCFYLKHAGRVTGGE
jgi:hypothetical protein